MINLLLHTIKNIFNYKGRANRNEVINFYICIVILAVIIGIMPDDFKLPTALTDFMVTIFFLVLVLLKMALCVRRYHDIGWSGWCTIINFIPILNLIGFFIIVFMPTNQKTKLIDESQVLNVPKE